MFFVFLVPCILKPTCVTERSAILTATIFSNSSSINAIRGNLVSKISVHLPQLLTVDNIKVNYKILKYYKNDCTKFDEDKFVYEFTVINWETIANTNLDANTNLIFFFFMIKFLSSSTLMCQVESFQSVKLSYPLNPGLPKKHLLRCNRGIRSIPMAISVISQIQN